MFFFFFFKQKTAYEMRISDWSSDMCSSDLASAFLVVDDGVCREARRKPAARLHRPIDFLEIQKIALVHQADGFHAWPGYGERGSTDEIGFGYDLAGIESGLDGLSGCDRISPSRPARNAGPVQQLKPVGAKIIADHRAQQEQKSVG